MFFFFSKVGDLSLIATSCRFLACYNLEQGNLDISYTYAQRCLNFDMSKVFFLCFIFKNKLMKIILKLNLKISGGGLPNFAVNKK